MDRFNFMNATNVTALWNFTENVLVNMVQGFRLYTCKGLSPRAHVAKYSIDQSRFPICNLAPFWTELVVPHWDLSSKFEGKLKINFNSISNKLLTLCQKACLPCLHVYDNLFIHRPLMITWFHIRYTTATLLHPTLFQIKRKWNTHTHPHTWN